MEQQGRAAIANSEANMAMGRMLSNGFAHMIHSHPDGAAGVARDVVCIVLSLALIPTGIGMIGVIGLVGGSILLGVDGTAYAMEISGDEEGAAKFKERTETIRIVATVMTLPDLTFGGAKAIRELQEIRELRALDLTTAKSAVAMALQTAKAGRAAKFEQITEPALFRSQIRSEQIAELAAEVLAGLGGRITAGEMTIREEARGRLLPTAIFVRWEH
jgi:hypothetical protein